MIAVKLAVLLCAVGFRPRNRPLGKRLAKRSFFEMPCPSPRVRGKRAVVDYP